MADPREAGIRVSASFPAAVGHTHWDWSSSNPALSLRGLTRERLSALDAGPHVASSACCCPLNPFGRRSADRFTRLLPAGSGLSRQDQTNLCHGAPIRPTTPTHSPSLPLIPRRPDRLSCCRTLFTSEQLSPSARERLRRNRDADRGQTGRGYPPDRSPLARPDPSAIRIALRTLLAIDRNRVSLPNPGPESDGLRTAVDSIQDRLGAHPLT
jgi:hypothetical protein